MNKLKSVGAIILIALTLSGCGLLPEKADMEPSPQLVKVPDLPDPDDG